MEEAQSVIQTIALNEGQIDITVRNILSHTLQSPYIVLGIFQNPTVMDFFNNI